MGVKWYHKLNKESEVQNMVTLKRKYYVAMRGKLFTVRVNKNGKKTHKNIRAYSMIKNKNEIVIKGIGGVFVFDRSEYETKLIYD